eukprot:1160919-Pelagomonas_calceolata.AAC.6
MPQQLSGSGLHSIACALQPALLDEAPHTTIRKKVFKGGRLIFIEACGVQQKVDVPAPCRAWGTIPSQAQRVLGSLLHCQYYFCTGAHDTRIRSWSTIDYKNARIEVTFTDCRAGDNNRRMVRCLKRMPPWGPAAVHGAARSSPCEGARTAPAKACAPHALPMCAAMQ